MNECTHFFNLMRPSNQRCAGNGNEWKFPFPFPPFPGIMEMGMKI